MIKEGAVSDLMGVVEVRDICENCETSSHCSQLRLALAILGESLTESPNVAIAQRYHDIRRILAEAGWNYPQSGRHCQLSDQSELVRSLTDELIHLAKKKPRIRKSDHTKEGHDLNLSPSYRAEMDGSLYAEETSCE